MSKKVDNTLEQLKKILSQTKSDICKQWANIKTTDAEISYKKIHFNDKYEYYTAKVALAQSPDKAFFKWVLYYESITLSSPEGAKAIGSEFTKQELDDFRELSAKLKQTKTSKGGFSFTMDDAHEPENAVQFLRYNAYQARLEKAQCDFWKAPYELLSEHCGDNLHIDLQYQLNILIYI